jgi:hypothetical protein
MGQAKKAAAAIHEYLVGKTDGEPGVPVEEDEDAY